MPEVETAYIHTIKAEVKRAFTAMGRHLYISNALFLKLTEGACNKRPAKNTTRINGVMTVKGCVIFFNETRYSCSSEREGEKKISQLTFTNIKTNNILIRETSPVFFLQAAALPIFP